MLPLCRLRYTNWPSIESPGSGQGSLASSPARAAPTSRHSIQSLMTTLLPAPHLGNSLLSNFQAQFVAVKQAHLSGH